MNENVLEFLITFRSCTCDPVYVKEYSYSFFNELKENSQDEQDDYEIVISKAKNIDIDSIYKADLYELEIRLEYFTPQDYRERFSKIIEVWCNSFKNKLSNLWLQIANPIVLENTGKLHHSDVDIKEIAFGTMPDMQHFMQHYHYISNAEQKEIRCSFLHSQRKIMIYTCFTHSKSCIHNKNPIHNKFQFSYQSIVRVLIYYVPNSDLVEIYFHLRHTPFLYVRKTNKKEEPTAASVSFLASDQEYQAQTWERVLDFGCSCKRFLCSIERIGKCSVFKIVIPKKHKTYDVVERLIQRCFRDTAFYFTKIETKIRNKNHERFLKDFERFPFNNEMLGKISDHDLVNDIKFKCQFAWAVLLSRSLEIEDQISLKYECNSDIDHWEKLKDKLKSFYKLESTPYFKYSKFCDLINAITDAIVESFYDISDIVSKNHIFTFEDAFDAFFEHHLKSKGDEDVPDGMCLVRRIVITPSKILCLPPSEHFDNRVIRHFDTEHFLRVSIQDDNFQKLTFAVHNNSKRREFLNRVVGRILLKGIHIGLRNYEILAASNSQLREHGLWMYSRDKQGNTSKSIRKWMGDFQNIKNVAKYMARMGQCFSTSDEAVQVELKDDEVVELSEITKKRNGEVLYKFSDGVGMISKDLAEEVRRAFAQKHNPHFVDDVDLYEPSAFQIRYKGCKGMLAEADPNMLDGRKIGIRPSMEKFPCASSNVLEIVKISAPRAVFLNRPLITILENLGVPPGVFLELQKKMVFDLTDSLIYEKKAYKMLENCTSLKFPFMKLSKNEISMTQEPFFRSLLLCVYKSMIGNLKHKARIAIPPKYGRNMLGVIDETKTLKYGQVFVQYSKKVGNMLSGTKVLEGTVVVTKNPCMHPGDVRKLEAVDVKALHHIKDCIVFPAQGKRPHPDEMAGSDLDGDEFALFWEPKDPEDPNNPKLTFPVDNHEAMDYPANEEQEVDGPITVQHMIDFICRYIQHDHIGLMANAYLAWADYNPDGIFSDVCKRIAQKYPQALDFAKSGTTQSLDSNERPKYYPDFMEKGCQNNSYKSEKALGLLYRVIRNLEASVSNMKQEVSIVPDMHLEYPGWKMFEKLANQRKDQYTKRVLSILKKFGLRNEAEALTGYLGDISDCNKSKYDTENVSLLSKKYLVDTMKRYHLKFVKDCEEQSLLHPSLPKREIPYMLASSWYMVTYQDYETTVLSFPWVVSEHLYKMRSLNIQGTRRKSPESKFIDNFDTFLHSVFKNQFTPESEIESCYCETVLYHTILCWVKKSAFILTISSQDIFCIECFNRIIKNFKSNKMQCCSDSLDGCSCSNSCSPMKMILEFFKYYACEMIHDIGTCGNRLDNHATCEGFRVFNLQSLALKTYAVIAITQSMKYLGLIEDTSVDNDSDSYEEGDPIRVRVNEEFENILTGRVDEVCQILKDLSGVKQVFIDGSNNRNAYYILVQSIGKAFNRWNLEELIMDPKCPEIIKSRLQ